MTAQLHPQQDDDRAILHRFLISQQPASLGCCVCTLELELPFAQKVAQPPRPELHAAELPELEVIVAAPHWRCVAPSNGLHHHRPCVTSSC